MVSRGRDWQVERTSAVLRAMSAVEDLVIVGIHSDDRMREYPAPGYEAYARSLAEEIAPEAQRLLRVGTHRRHRSVWDRRSAASSLSTASGSTPTCSAPASACRARSRTRNNLIDRVLSEPARDVAFYLDSGWPGDNYEVTMAMAMVLVARGWRYGLNLLHFCFPHAEHDESAWGLRLHLPLQILIGAVARASRVGTPVLGDQPWRSPQLGK